MTDSAGTAGRRLHVLEIAVLADDQELKDLRDRIDALLHDQANRGDTPPAAITCYDGATLPRPMQAELLDEIHTAQAVEEDRPVPDGYHAWPVAVQASA
ncbi:hypothetical protein ACNTMW_24220 [Planosporangium sp. 12N6]|uniref:hypothetical protein n=1 Tax=Planosporangium spinosum TaxID=3402278 RepID=UPI003CF3602F